MDEKFAEEKINDHSGDFWICTTCTFYNAPSEVCQTCDTPNPKRQRSNINGGPPKRILCLDGGGIRGIMTCRILKQMEIQFGKPISEMFDLICGTSTGGLLALGIGARNLPLEACEKLYYKVAKDVFANPYFFSRIWRNKHNCEKLEQIFEEYLDGENLGEYSAHTKVFVVSTRSGSSLRPYLFRNYDIQQSPYLGRHDIPIQLAARGTTAAPLYFDAMEFDNVAYIDGGVVANNPSKIALDEAKKIWPDSPIDLVVSIGTGTKTNNPHNRGCSSTLNLGGRIVDLLTESQSTHESVEQFCGGEGINYYRFNPDGGQGSTVELDESNIDVLNIISQQADEYMLPQSHGGKTLKKIKTKRQSFSASGPLHTLLKNIDTSNFTKASLEILVVGSTGVGKSSLVNSLFGVTKARTDSTESCTNEMTQYKSKVIIGGTTFWLKVTDTPGLNELGDNDKTFERFYKSNLEHLSFDLIFYVFRFDRTRFGSADANVKRFINMYGKDSWKRSLIVFTHGLSNEPDECNSLEGWRSFKKLRFNSVNNHLKPAFGCDMRERMVIAENLSTKKFMYEKEADVYCAVKYPKLPTNPETENWMTTLMVRAVECCSDESTRVAYIAAMSYGEICAAGAMGVGIGLVAAILKGGVSG